MPEVPCRKSKLCCTSSYSTYVILCHKFPVIFILCNKTNATEYSAKSPVLYLTSSYYSVPQVQAKLYRLLSGKVKKKLLNKVDERRPDDIFPRFVCMNTNFRGLVLKVMFRLVGRELGCILIKSTLDLGKTQEGWRLEGEGLAGAIGGKRGQFTSNRGLKWTFRHKLEDAK